MRAALYARVSTEEQTEGYSLDAQVASFREYCRDNGWQVVKEYLEPGVSARSAKRPIFQEMMEDAEAGLFDILVVHKLDRFSRSLRDTIAYLGALAGHNVGFLSVLEAFDHSTPVGRLQLHILAALAQWYSENLGQEVKKGVQQRIRQGFWVGNLSTGYCLGLCAECQDDVCPHQGDGERGDGRRAIPHPIDSETVRLLFELYASGQHSYDTLGRELTARGLSMRTRHGRRPWIAGTINKTIKNPFYIGLVRHKGKTYTGQHQALIALDLWERCQEIREWHRRYARTHSPKFRSYLFKGILRCEGCGLSMSAATARGTVGPHYRCMSYYKQIGCPAPRWPVRESLLEMQITDIVAGLELPPRWQNRIEELVCSPQDAKGTEREKKSLQERLERLKEAYLNLIIGKEEFVSRVAEIEARVATLDPPAIDEVRIAAEHLKTMRAAWDAATKDERGRILRTLLEAAYCEPLARSLVALQPKPAFAVLFRQIEGLEENEGKFYIKKYGQPPRGRG